MLLIPITTHTHTPVRYGAWRHTHAVAAPSRRVAVRTAEARALIVGLVHVRRGAGSWQAAAGLDGRQPRRCERERRWSAARHVRVAAHEHAANDPPRRVKRRHTRGQLTALHIARQRVPLQHRGPARGEAGPAGRRRLGRRRWLRTKPGDRRVGLRRVGQRGR